ncbi:acyl-CoA dehydrogenase [Natronospirillum operosum]|uniref:Acyl-CoA dehydrogenase n=1 Tax=Natronospirillum operosum TaxID=2759953 RepID=A0A4Z0W4Y9_9GAMM|nr:acyl-CoA dehydrogenase [Natronospirillum operosum]TGG90608.1 acyl-CoA dehydrogenase [Natronospirillum operosum]
MVYHPPLADIRFVLKHLIGPQQRASVPAFADLDEDTVDAILQEAARFAVEVLAPLQRVGDQQGCRLDEQGRVRTPEGWTEAFAQFRAAGWTAARAPQELGGQALPQLLATMITEFWQGANMAFSLLQPLTDGALEALAEGGATDLLDKYGPGLTQGEWAATMALTEPAAGSDLGRVATKAVPAGDGRYRLSGNKIYITYGDHDLAAGILHLVLARVPDAPAGSRGLSLFAVPSHLDVGQRNAVTCTGLEHKLGLHGSPTCSLQFGAEEGALAYLVGTLHQGLPIMFVMMNAARLSVGMQAVGVIERGYQTALGWARERRQGHHPVTGESAVLIEHPDVKRLLLRIRSQTLALRLLGYWLAFQQDRVASAADVPAQGLVDLLTPVFKAYASEAANRLAGDVIQIFGGLGFVEETGVAQLYRDLRISTIYEGTTGIQAQDLVLRKLLRDQGTVFQIWVDQVAADLELCRHPQVTVAMPLISSALQQLDRGVRTLLQTSAENPIRLHGGSVALLEAMGVLASAWQLVRAVTAMDSTAPATDPQADLPDLLNAYCAQFLPDVGAHLQRLQRADWGQAARLAVEQ